MQLPGSAQPIVVAHRGLHAHHPENSRQAILAAWDAGFAWCECDVHASADGKAVVIHDQTLERTAGRNGKVRDWPWSQLRELHLLDGREMVTESRLPSLAEIVSSAMPRQGHLLVEIKPPNDEGLVRETVRLLGGQGCMIHSFDEANLHHVRRLNPTLPVGLLLEDRELLEAALKQEWTALHLNHRLVNAEVAAAVRQRGKMLGVWTVNEGAEIRRVLPLRPNMIITDVPQRVREIQSGLVQG